MSEAGFVKVLKTSWDTVGGKNFMSTFSNILPPKGVNLLKTGCTEKLENNSEVSDTTIKILLVFTNENLI